MRELKVMNAVEGLHIFLGTNRFKEKGVITFPNTLQIGIRQVELDHT